MQPIKFIQQLTGQARLEITNSFRKEIISMERINTYEKFLEQEGLPVVREYGIADLMAVPLKPWSRKGGFGAFINLIGGEENLNAYLCEIPP